MPQTLLVLGGGLFQLSAQRAARRLGLRVVSLDNRPQNPGHALAHRYYNISTRDREGALAVARQEQVDGVLAYASDIAAPTAAYVAGALGLPGNPLPAVQILTDKAAFRHFLAVEGFACPRAAAFARAEAALPFLQALGGQAIVKPVDCSGSKGVQLVHSAAQLTAAFAVAQAFSVSGRVLLEQYIPHAARQLDGDILLWDGEIIAWALMEQYTDPACAPFAPTVLCYPPAQKPMVQARARAQLQHLCRRLGLRSGLCNVEYILDSAGEIYILEIGPRAGGNLIPDAYRAATGLDLAEAAVRAALGQPPWLGKPHPGCAASFVLHSRRAGPFAGLWLAPAARRAVAEKRLLPRVGEAVPRFAHGGDALGGVVLRFAHPEPMRRAAQEPERLLRILLG